MDLGCVSCDSLQILQLYIRKHTAIQHSWLVPCVNTRIIALWTGHWSYCRQIDRSSDIYLVFTAFSYILFSSNSLCCGNMRAVLNQNCSCRIGNRQAMQTISFCLLLFLNVDAFQFSFKRNRSRCLEQWTGSPRLWGLSYPPLHNVYWSKGLLSEPRQRYLAEILNRPVPSQYLLGALSSSQKGIASGIGCFRSGSSVYDKAGAVNSEFSIV